MSAATIWLWIGFNLFILALLALDLGVFHRRAHAVSVKEAAIWTAVWIALALIFNAVVYLWRGPQAALEFFTGYLIEKSLSVDNIFVFVVLFSYFQVPAAYQHRVLFWGILGALITRGAMILLGAALLEHFHWMIYLFGAFLVFTAVRISVQKEIHIDVERNLALRLVRRVFPVTKEHQGPQFFVRQNGRLLATPLLLVLVTVELTDVMFAIDSIPAIFAVTRDTFIVYTSNVFAILGLRSLYFALAGVVIKFHYLRPALAVILGFVGAKMLVSEAYKMPAEVSLSAIAVVLGVAVVASVLRSRLREKTRRPSASGHPAE